MGGAGVVGTDVFSVAFVAISVTTGAEVGLADGSGVTGASVGEVDTGAALGPGVGLSDTGDEEGALVE